MQTLTSVYFYSSAGLVLLIFIAAVVQKFRQPNDFIRALAGYRLVPDGALRFWWLLPLTELLAALELLLSIGESRWLGLSLLLLYAAAIAINLLRGRHDIDCGCGGEATPIGWGLVMRNVVLAGLAVPQHAPIGELMGLGVALTFVALLLGALGYAIATQLCANSARGGL